MSENGGGFNREQGAGLRQQMIDDALRPIPHEKPVLIAGPTASGKSALALALAQRDGRVVVNADALQVYAPWRILTARPSVAEESQARHALYGHLPFDAPYSVGHWLRDIAPLLSQPVVIVGGTGLYFMALTEGLAEIPAIPQAVRARGDALRQNDPQAMIAALDADTAAKTDLQNLARVQRSWEVLQTTGRGLVEWQKATPAPLLPLHKAHAILLAPPVDWLNARIDRRFDAMMGAGALQEVRDALPRWNPDLTAARAIGAPELVAHLRGEMTLDQAVSAAKIASRQYAKRQRTWFRSKMGAWRAVDPS